MCFVAVVVWLKLRWMLHIFLVLYSLDTVYTQFILRKRISKNFTSQFLITLSLLDLCVNVCTGNNHSWVICVTDHLLFQVEFFPNDRLLSCFWPYTTYNIYSIGTRFFASSRLFCIAAVVVVWQCSIMCANWYVDAIVIKHKNVIAFELSMLFSLHLLSIKFHRHQIVINLRKKMYIWFRIYCTL